MGNNNYPQKTIKAIEMAEPSIKFKKALMANDQSLRERILWNLMGWLMKQVPHDPMAAACHQWIQSIHSYNAQHLSKKDLNAHCIWDTASNHDKCISFQEIVKAKLSVPQTNIKELVEHPEKTKRKPIPKKIRGEVWTKHFGDSTNGFCYCCKTPLNCFEDWHAGHIIAQSRGGTDTADNLRPVCGSCNLSMGSESMDEFKARCYPGV